MDQSPPKRRFRFGLRGLLLLDLICAVATQLFISRYSALEHRGRRIKPGMTMQEVHQILGKPLHAFPSTSDPDWHTDIYHEKGSMWKSEAWLTVRYLNKKVQYKDR